MKTLKTPARLWLYTVHAVCALCCLIYLAQKEPAEMFLVLVITIAALAVVYGDNE